MASPKILTEALALSFLSVLSDGTPPFIAIAADRCGLSRTTVNRWLAIGRDDLDQDRATQEADLACAVARVRGDFIAAEMKIITSMENKNSTAVAQRQWIITRLDRDLFESKSASARVDDPEPKKAPSRRTHASPEAGHEAPDVKQAADALALPEKAN